MSKPGGDSTQRGRDAIRALRESEERYRRLFEDDLTGNCLATAQGRIITCNPAFARIFGFPSVAEALGFDLRRLYPTTEDHARFLRLLSERGKLEHYESFRVRRDGTGIHVVENAVGTFDATGSLVEIKSYAYDDTDRKRAETGWADAREQYRSLVELIPDPVLVSDLETILYANQAALTLVGAANPTDLIGRLLRVVFHPEDHDKVSERSALVFERNRTLPLERRRMLRMDGEAIDVEVAVGTCVFDGRRGVVRVCRDISDRIRWEEDLLQKDEEISRNAERVDNLNTALKVLLEHREQEARQKDANIRATLDKLVFPYLDSLKAGRLDDGQQGLVDIIDTNLREISSSFARELSSWHEKLTPTEIQVADMVLAGKRSKEIATLLRVSDSAVAFHRGNIRGKLGLTKRTANLVSYLRSISKK